MKRLPALILLIALTILPSFAQEASHSEPSAAAHASETGHASEADHGEHAQSLGGENVTLWKSLNFVLFVGLIVYALRGKVGPFFAGVNKAIAKGMADAAVKADEAQVRLTAVERKLADLGNEISGLREHAATEMERDRERVQQETAAEIQRLQSRAEAEIHAAASQAQARLRHQAATLALELAEQQVKAEAASPGMQHELLVHAVERLSRAGKSARN
ncbi:MAG: ATP synthase F0 subunit B [Bryobacterales bacterium]|nr:ATP synthase F0 subunit B [Bryobacterales bacterium]